MIACLALASCMSLVFAPSPPTISKAINVTYYVLPPDNDRHMMLLTPDGFVGWFDYMYDDKYQKLLPFRMPIEWITMGPWHE